MIFDVSSSGDSPVTNEALGRYADQNHKQKHLITKQLFTLRRITAADNTIQMHESISSLCFIY